MYQTFLDADFSKFSIGDQKSFGEWQVRSISVGDSVTLDLSAFDYENNQYQWKKDGQEVPGATSSVLTIDSVQASDAGSYVLTVTNSDMAELGVHESEPITLAVS